MRYWFKLFLFLLLSASCAKNEYVTYRDQTPKTEEHHNPELIAKTIYSHFYDKDTKGADLLPLSSNTLRDSLATVVNFQDNGFVIYLNNGKNTPLVVCEQGQYPGDSKDNLSMSIISSILDTAEEMRSPRSFPDPSESTIFEDITRRDSLIVSPLIEVLWHQTDPFTLYTPNNYIAGCVPVAIAQAMSVFSYPASIDLTYPGANMSSCTLDWINMKAYIHSIAFMGIFHDSQSCTYCHQCGQLLRQLGELCDVVYGPTSSSTSLHNFTSVLSSLGYTSSYTNSFSTNTVVSSLQSGYPVILNGANDGSCHAYNVDGCKQYEEASTIYVYEGGSWHIDSYNYTSWTYLHCCYGLQVGLFNGYYASQNIFQTIPENGIPVIVNTDELQGPDWNLVHAMNYNIHPISQL